MGNEQSFESDGVAQAELDDGTVTSSGAVVSGKAKGIIKSDYPVSVMVEKETFQISIPHNYATNGW